MNQILRDRYGWIIAEIRTDGSKSRLLDRYGLLLGWYEARLDMTFDRYGTMIARGNLLTTLLSDAK